MNEEKNSVLNRKREYTMMRVKVMLENTNFVLI